MADLRNAGFYGSADPTFWEGNPNRLGGNQANDSLLRAARERVDPIQTAARNAAQAPRPAPVSTTAPIANPNVGPAGSADAQAWRALRNPSPASVPDAGSASRLAKFSEGAGRMAGNALRVAGPAFGRAAVGADVVSHFNDYKIDDPSVDSSASGTWNALKQGDFPGVGRSMSKGLLETGMDLGSAAANTLDYVVPGKAPVSTAYDGMLRNTFGNQLKAAPGVSAAPAAPTQPAISPGDQTPAETSRLLRNDTSLAAGVAPLGNGQNGVPAAPATQTDNSMALRKMERDAQTQRDAALGNSMEADRLKSEAAMRVGQDAQFAANKAVGDNYNRNLLRKNLETSASSFVNDGTRRNADRQLAAMDLQDNNILSQGGETTRAGMKVRGDQQIASLRDATDRRGQDLTYDSNMVNHRLQAETNRARLSYEMGKDQRDYATGRSDKAMEQRMANDKAWNDHAATIFQTVDKDGKSIPDTAKIAAYTRATDETVGKMSEALMASNDPVKRAYGEKLSKMGRAALDDQDKASMTKWFMTQQLHQQTAGGVNPFGSKGDVSLDLRAYANPRSANGVVQPRTGFVGPDGKPTGIEIPNVNLDYGADANYFLPNFKPASTSLR